MTATTAMMFALLEERTACSAASLAASGGHLFGWGSIGLLRHSTATLAQHSVLSRSITKRLGGFSHRRKIVPVARELHGDVRLLASCRELLEQKTLSGGVLSHPNIRS